MCTRRLLRVWPAPPRSPAPPVRLLTYSPARAPAQVSLLPPVAAIAVSALAGPSADALIARGVPVERVRKAAQCLAFLGPAACLLAAGSMESGPVSVGESGAARFPAGAAPCAHIVQAAACPSQHRCLPPRHFPPIHTAPSRPAAALVTLALGLASFSLAGLYCNHADLSPRCAVAFFL